MLLYWTHLGDLSYTMLVSQRDLKLICYITRTQKKEWIWKRKGQFEYDKVAEVNITTLNNNPLCFESFQVYDYNDLGILNRGSSFEPTRSIVVTWVNLNQIEVMVEIYSKSLVRAIGKVLLIKFS